jgi:putative nucleotidyltransferase with HDIG domain
VKAIDMSDYSPAGRWYWCITTVIGLFVIGGSSTTLLRSGHVELFEIVGLMTAAFLAGLRPIRIPGTQAWVTPGDIFVFLAVLFWGVPAGTLVAATDSVAISSRTSKRLTSVLGGPAIVSTAVFVSASLFEYALDGLHRIDLKGTGILLPPLLLFSLLYFLLNTFLIAGLYGIKLGVPVVGLWRTKYFWMGLTYAAAASAAWLIYICIIQIGIVSVLAAGPLVAIILAACHFYFKQAEEHENAIKRISEIHLATVEALAIAIDAKDQITHDHVYRVQVYACGLGRYFGLTDPEIEALKAGALLHDVGKIAVPDYILNKPGKLTAAEFDKMKIHTVVGAQIMERINFPYPVVPIVRHHHERWDGNGYPDSLKGEKIPITARVLTVADCFDAVREDRQYRKGMTRDEACQYLSEAAGKQFDPRVVEAFLSNLPKFEMEIEAHKSGAQPLLMPTKQAGLSAKAMSAVPAAGLAQSEPEPPEYLAPGVWTEMG